MRTALLLLSLCAEIVYAQPGSIAGTVVDAADGKPIAGAFVSLQIPFKVYNRQGVGSAVADAGGRFLLRSVKPGEEYFIAASKPGYLSGDEAVGLPRRAWVEPSEKVIGIVLRLTREGKVRGRVVAAAGELLPTIRVAVLHWAYEGGEKYLRVAQNGGSSVVADGSFAVGNLAPDTYYLSAGNAFYGSGASLGGAKAIEIKPGVTIDGVEIRLEYKQAYQVRGTAIVSEGSFEWLSIKLCPPGQDVLCLAANRPEPNKTFVIDDVPPGTYEIQAAGGNAGQTVRVSDRVTVGDQTGNVEIRFASATKVSGVIRGVAPDYLGAGTTLSLVHIGPYGSIDAFTELPVKAGLTFERQVAPSLFRFTVARLPLELYVESIRDGTKDITYGTWNLGQSGSNIEVSLREGAATVEGSVTDTEGYCVPVTIWADSPGGFSATMMSGPEGEFRFWNVPPGNYRIAAWEGITQGKAEYPAFFRSYDQTARRITLAPGAKAEIEFTASK